MLALAATCWTACDDNETSTVGFTTATGSGEESDSVYTIKINLGRTVSTATTVTYAVGGSAGLDGDYTFSTTDPGDISTTPPLESSNFTLTVNPGASSATISFRLIDDKLVEPTREVIYFQITAISDTDIANAANSIQYTFEITDNDVPPTNALQADLSWTLGDGISINQVNFDLLLANHVTLDENDAVTGATLIDSVYSIHDTGPETFKLFSSLPDDEYYIMIRYTTGSSDAQLTLILSEDNTYSRARGVVTSDYAGKMVYYGPIQKSGDTYSRHTQAPEPTFKFPAH